jgi:hypothetical protein
MSDVRREAAEQAQGEAAERVQREREARGRAQREAAERARREAEERKGRGAKENAREWQLNELRYNLEVWEARSRLNIMPRFAVGSILVILFFIIYPIIGIMLLIVLVIGGILDDALQKLIWKKEAATQIAETKKRLAELETLG